MAIWFRHGPAHYPFIREDSSESARWHVTSDGPTTYFADTPDGAWAEFLRHEEITDVDDLAGIHRWLWAVEIPHEVDSAAVRAAMDLNIATGDISTYPACQDEGRRARHAGASALRAPSAALLPGAARGQVTRAGLGEGSPRDGEVLVLFGHDWHSLRGWVAGDSGGLSSRHLGLVRALT